jgi:hypothetical protein
MNSNPYQEFISCQKDFFYFAENYLKIRHPSKGIIPLVLHDYQKKYLELCDEWRFLIGIKFRQGGYTTIGVLKALWKCMFIPNRTYYIAAKTNGEAAHIGKLVDNAIELFPNWLAPCLGKNTEKSKYFSTGSKLLFGDIDSMRGLSVTDVIIDEPAFIPDMDKKWTTVWECFPNKGEREEIQSSPHTCVAISVTNGIGNWFEKTWHKAEAGRVGFYSYRGNYLDHPDYSNPLWIEQARKDLGERGFAQEVLGQFLAPEDNSSKIDFSSLSDKKVSDLLTETLISLGSKLSEDQIRLMRIAASRLNS